MHFPCAIMPMFLIRPVGQAAKTAPSHGAIMGSIPVRVTKEAGISSEIPASFLWCPVREYRTHRKSFYGGSHTAKGGILRYAAQRSFIFLPTISSTTLPTPHSKFPSLKSVLRFGKPWCPVRDLNPHTGVGSLLTGRRARVYSPKAKFPCKKKTDSRGRLSLHYAINARGCRKAKNSFTAQIANCIFPHIIYTKKNLHLQKIFAIL